MSQTLGDAPYTTPLTPVDHQHPEYQPTTEKGQAGGYAALDTGTKVPIGQLPTGATGVTVAAGDHNHDERYALAGHSHPASGGAVQVVKKIADQAIGVVALTNVADLAIPLAANEVRCFDVFVIWQSAATTTGIQFGLAGPAGLAELTAWVEVASSPTALNGAHLLAPGGAQLLTATDAANTRRVARIRGAVVNGSNAGTLQVQARSEVAGSAVTVKRGSYGLYF